ncbi:MAG: ABC transporter substrate-binding protein [Thermodesulfobacteriota bacterium]
MRLRAAAVLIIVLSIATPSWGWVYFSPKDRAAELVDIFEDIELNGPDREAMEDLKGYIEAHPLAKHTDEAIIRLARIYVRKKNAAEAIRLYERLLDKYPATRFKFDALLELGYLRYRSGDLKAARSLVEEVSKSGVATISLRVKSRLLLKNIGAALLAAGPEIDAPAIGALLPLKGRYAQFGEAALRGVLLAAEVFGSRYGAVTVYVKDVGAEPGTAGDAVAELVGDEKVLGLVGPLLSSTSTEVARYAQNSRIPLVTLTQKEGITGAGDYVFRNFLTTAQQAEALADYAVNVMRLKRFAVMHPENYYGRDLAALFEREVVKRGGEIVGSVSYAPGNRDFSGQLTQLFEIKMEEKREGRRTIREYIPGVEVDALFIPDSYETVALASPYLDYYSIEGVRLLGANGWNSPDLVKEAGDYVEGAVFVDGYFSESTRPGTVEFTERFRETFGMEPGEIEAQAYDAARVIITAINEDLAAVPSRRALKTRIKRIEGYEGACGELSFDRRREAVKKLFVLTVRDGMIVEAPEEIPFEEDLESPETAPPAPPGWSDGADGPAGVGEL